jgi:hypothetical protein
VTSWSRSPLEAPRARGLAKVLGEPPGPSGVRKKGLSRLRRFRFTRRLQARKAPVTAAGRFRQETPSLGAWFGAGLLVSSVCLGVWAARAGASGALTNGPITLNTTGTVTPNTPYSSGQTIDITVAANSTLNAANLDANGYSGTPNEQAEECSDLDGTTANLPTTSAGNCDSVTLNSVSGNSDGSFTITGFTILALPDVPIFNEPPSHTPVCGLAPYYCVLYIGPSANNLNPKTELFSAPFVVQSNSDDGGENPGDGTQPAQSATSATNSTVVATPSSAVADGADISKVTVTLKDTNGSLVTGGKEVSLSQSTGGHSVIDLNGSAATSGMTDATTGAISFTVSDPTPETVTYTAMDVTDSVTISASPSVQFVPPAVTPANSTITAVPTTVPSGNSCTITVTLNDQAAVPTPVANKVVALAQGSGNSTITAVSATTDAQGHATFTATDSNPEAVTYSATDTTDDIPLSGVSVTVTFGTLSVSATASTVVANPTVLSSVASGGVLPTGTVTVTLIAPDGHSPVSGKSVSLTASSSNAQINSTPSPAVTDSNGKATFTVSDGTAEDVTFTAQDTTDGFTIAETASISFQKPAPSASTSGLTASVSTEIADGVTPVSLVVTVLDQFNQPVPGASVTVAGNPPGTTRIAPQEESTSVPAGTTDATGKALFYAYDTTAESVVYTATDTSENFTIAQTVSVLYTAAPAEADKSSLSANPMTVPADGASSSTVAVTLRDHNGNPVPGKSITLTADAGSSTITGVTPVTDARGQATFKVTDTKSEIVTYSATDTTDNLVLAGQGVAVTFGSPQPEVPAVADSTVTGSPTTVPADGTSTAAITVVLSDADGSALSGKTVSLNPGAGNSVVTTVQGVTDADGIAKFTVSDPKAESVTFEATDVTDGLPLTGESVTITFTPATTSSGTGSTSSTTSTTETTLVSGSTGSGSAAGSSTAEQNSGSTNSADSGNAISSASSSTLAFTGTPGSVRWVLAIGCFLLGIGTIGRRRLAAATRRGPCAHARLAK